MSLDTEMAEQIVKLNEENKRLKAIVSGIKKLEDSGIDTKNYVLVDNDSVKQLAIEELEKIKDFIISFIDIKGYYYTELTNTIDKRIKQLKGE